MLEDICFAPKTSKSRKTTDNTSNFVTELLKGFAGVESAKTTGSNNGDQSGPVINRNYHSLQDENLLSTTWESAEEDNDQKILSNGKNGSSKMPQEFKNKNLRNERERHLKNTITEGEAEVIFRKLEKNQKLKTNFHQVKRWSVDETKLFFFAIAKYLNEKSLLESELTTGDWKVISKLIPGCSVSQCEYKWSMTRKQKTKKAEWSLKENNTLKSLVIKSAEDRNWLNIAKDLSKLCPGKYQRTAKQCKERWTNFLNPDINKLEFTPEEDFKLLTLHQKHARKWALIVKQMPGRAECMIKNRFNGLMKKESRDYHSEMNCSNDISSNCSIGTKKEQEFSELISTVVKQDDSEKNQQEIERILISRILSRLSIDIQPKNLNEHVPTTCPKETALALETVSTTSEMSVTPPHVIPHYAYPHNNMVYYQAPVFYYNYHVMPQGVNVPPPIQYTPHYPHWNYNC